MASALVKAMPRDQVRFLTYTPSKTRAVKLAEDIGGTAVESLDELKDADYFLLGFKPQQLDDFIKEAGSLLEGKNIISILTAISTAILCKRFKTNKVLRLMPNTPSLIGEGVLLSHHTNEFESLSLIVDLYQNCGKVAEVTEEQLDELTVFTGSGPAYLFVFAREYVRLLEAKGYDSKLSRDLMNQLFVGASKLMQNEDKDLDQMISEVTSKGGVTIEAVKVLESLTDTIAESIAQASRRNEELFAAANSSLK